MTAPVIVLGAGGHGKVVADALEAMGYSLLGFVDADRSKHGTKACGVPVLGGDDILGKHGPGAVLLANGVGSTGIMKLRREIFDFWRSKGYRFVTTVHPSATVSKHAIVGEGAQVMAGAIIQAFAQIGDNSIINTGAIVDHDCRIGKHCHLAPGCVLSGGVAIGDESHIGTAAAAIQGISIGRKVLVAAGSVAISSIPDDASVMGTPAKERKQ